MPYHSLGEIQFQGSYSIGNMDVTSKINLVEHGRIDGKPTIQYMGQNLDQITLNVMLHRQYTIPENRIQEFYNLMNQGQAAIFVTGAGDVIGSFVVEEIKTDYRATATDGSIIEAGLSVKLKEYYSPDLEASRETAARNDGFAFSENNPQPTTGPATTGSAIQASNELNALESQAEVLDSSAFTAESIPAQEENERRKMKISIAEIIRASNATRGIINSLSGDLYTDTRDLDTELLALISQAGTISTALNFNTAINLIRNQIETLQDNLSLVNAAAGELRKWAATRRA